MAFVLVKVKVYSLDSKWKSFLAQIIDGPDGDKDSEAIFLKRSMNKDDFFIQKSKTSLQLNWPT